MLKSFNSRNLFGSKFIKRTRYTSEEILKEWAGDAALSFLVRLFLIEKYPGVPVTFLVKREHPLLTNKGLRAYCERHKMQINANEIERILADKAVTNITEAKEIVADIWAHCEKIKELDRLELKDGKLSPEFISKQILYYSKKIETAKEAENGNWPGNPKRPYLEENLVFYQRLSEDFTYKDDNSLINSTL